MSKQNATRPDAKKAAKILSDFVSRDKSRTALQSVFHDKEAGVAVASDGRALIATKHGFDPDAKPLDAYYHWQKVIPCEKSLVNATTVNPAELAKTCKSAIRLAKATGYKGEYVIVALRMGDKGDKIATVDAKLMLKVAEAMAANGLTELRTGKDVGKEPIMTKNADTTIVFMPLRVNDGAADVTAGRCRGAHLVISADSGRIISAPERTDTGNFSRERLDASRKELGEAEIARIEKRIAAEDEIDALMGAPKPAPVEKATTTAVDAKTAAAPAVEAVEAAKTAADPAAWDPDGWKRLTRAKQPEMARVSVCAWAAASAPQERAELVLMANDYAYVFNEARKDGRADAAASQALIDFRTELDDELAERITRVYGAAKWDAVRACL